MRKISVIIPVFNGAKMIAKCIESVLKQDFNDYEIIIIDDGSTDNTKDICHDFVNKNKNIRYIYKDNGGVSSARNLGLDNAHGEFVIFIDHDDYIDIRYLSELYKYAVSNNLDIVRSGYKTVDENDNIVGKYGYKNENVVLPPNYYSVFLETTFFGYAGGVFIKKDVIDNLRFDTHYKFAEDMLFIRECYKKSQKMAYLNNYGYNYYVNPNSMTKRSDYNVRMKECEDNVRAFYSFVNYGVEISDVANCIYKRLNLKLKFLIKTTNVNFKQFKKALNDICEMDEMKIIYGKHNLHILNDDKKNTFLIYLLIKEKYFLYYSIVSLYHFLRK